MPQNLGHEKTIYEANWGLVKIQCYTTHATSRKLYRLDKWACALRRGVCIDLPVDYDKLLLLLSLLSPSSVIENEWVHHAHRPSAVNLTRQEHKSGNSWYRNRLGK